MKERLFITLEGIEGVGKTTQIKLLEDFFRKNSIEFISTREPGGSQACEAIRDIVLYQDVTPTTELMLYEAARSEHFRTVIEPALNNNKTVICDRFIDATVAYQGYGRGLDIDLINQLNDVATKGLSPDLTFVIDVAVDLAFKRLRKRTTEFDRFERLSSDFYENVRRGYIEQSKRYPKRVIIIDGNGSIEDIHSTIIREIEKRD